MGLQKEYFIGIDAGTTAIKSVLFDCEGNELYVAHQNVPVEVRKPGYQEMSLIKVWEAAAATIRQIVENAGISVGLICTIGVTAQGCGAWMIDEEGNPIRDAILWSDNRANDIVNEWVESGIAAEIYKISGCDPFSGGQGSIIKWLQQNEPDVLKHARHVLYCKDWIKYKLTGVIGTEPSEVSISYLDQKQRNYSTDILKLIGIDEYAHLLPPIQPTDKPAGDLLPKVAKDLGLPVYVKVVSSSFDVSSSAIGVGAIKNGDACTILGTSLINEVVMDRFDTEPLNVGFTIPLGPDSRWVRMITTKLGTPNQDWLLSNLCAVDYCDAEINNQDIFDYLQEKVSHIPIGADGIIFTPFISAPGLRAQFLHQNAKAQFIGLSQEHTRHHLLRAVLEGTAFAIRHCYENIPIKVDNIKLSGGGSKNPLWCQIISDVLNTAVKVPAGSEFGARGAAINAAVAVGFFDSFETAVGHFVKYDREYLPNINNHKQYDKLYQIYKKIYPQMEGIWDALASFRNWQAS